MDGESFDRLSVVVHRLRDQASRRSAFRLLLGGSLVAAGVQTADEADAKKRKKHKNGRRCRGYGAGCGSNKDCCNGQCRNGRCWFTNGGNGGGGRCGGNQCPNGWVCRNQSGVHVCVPDNFTNNCGGNTWYGSNFNCCDGIYTGACTVGGDCCGSLGMCCQNGWQCCGGRTCIPRDWDCDDFFRQSAGEVGSESGERIPSASPTPVDEKDYITIEPDAQ